MKFSITAKTKALVLTLSLLVITLITASLALAQDGGVKPIGLVSGGYVPAKIMPAEVTFSQKDIFDGNYFKLIQFAQIPDDTERRTWEKDGLHLVDYLPVNTYFAVIDQDFDLNRLSGDVLTIIDVDNIFRMEPELANLRAQEQSTDKLVVSYYFSIDAQKVISDLQSRGVVIENHRDYSRQLDIIIDPAQLDEIVALPYIQFIGPEPPEPELESYYSNSTGRGNYLNTGYNGLNYNGDGVVICIAEGGTAGNYIDVKGRFTEMNTGNPSSHKIGCMRNAGGGGNDDPTEKNNACGSSIISTNDGPNYAALYSSHNLRFTNHSTGWGNEGRYDQGARDRDLLTASHPLALISYSSGNSGGNTGYAPYDGFSGWANITGARKQNKNHFAIRSIGGDDAVQNWTSCGPTYDGRIVPQLIIEGWAGSSYASPKVVGLMAVLAEVYKDKNGGEAPANLLRAIMMNTADEVDDPGPDFKSGYGRPNMRRAYNVINTPQFLTSSVANGNTNTHNITVPANTKQVRVMLMWPDVAAAVNANPAIVNNLNLLVKDPPATTSYNPWVLDHRPDPVLLDMPATRQVDNLNTMEQVTVDNPTAGSWTIEVNGAHVPDGPQTYYIVYEFLMDELHMGFPLKDVRFKSGNSYYLKWDSYGVSGTFNLDYQLDGGGWVNIVTGHDATSRSYQWATPSVGAGIHTVKIRVQRGALSAESDVNYIGDVPQNLAVEWACSDVVKLSWEAVDGATGYKVQRLGTKYMEEVTTNITFDGASAILTGLSTTEDEYFAVSAVTGSNEGLRTNALEKAAGDYNCFNVKTTVASEVDKTNIKFNGLVNPHGSTLTDVRFEYGTTTTYGSYTPNITISATGHTEEAVNSTIASTLSSRTDLLHFRLVGKSDASDVYGDNQETRLAPGNDFTFDGTDDYIDVSNNDNLPIYNNGTGNAYTVSMWVKGAAQDDKRVFSEGNSSTNDPVLLIGTNTAGKIRVFLRDDLNSTIKDVASSTTVFDDTWHHIAWVDDNGNAKMYIDGAQDAADFTYTRTTLSLDRVAIGAVLRASSSNFFNGRIDEVSMWGKALTAAEIRDLMHQPLAGNETDLKTYFNLDGVSDRVFDVVTATEAQIVGGGSKTSSTSPFGVGVEFTAAEAAGTVTFTGTGFEANYSSQNGATVIVSKIEIEPNATNGFSGSAVIFDNQYWVAHRHGSGSFSADVTFKTSEDLTAADEGTPGQIQLFSRDKGSDGDWVFVTTANSVSAADDKATFNGITAFDKQFIISRNTDPFISASENTLTYRNTKTGCTYQQHSYDLSGVNLTANLDVTPPTGFQVSTNASSGFAGSLSLTPTGGSVSETIYVRLTPSSAGSFSGDVANSSTDATTVNVNIPAFEVLDVADNATRAMTFDGSNDYLDVQDFDWNPVNVFTVEWWLKPNTHTNWNQQVGNGWGHFLFHTDSDGKVNAGITTGNSKIVSAAGALVLNEWQHFAYTLDGSHAKLYRNGELLGETTNSSGYNQNWGHFNIGKNSNQTINGQLDEFRMWSTARTQQEIRDNMHNVLAGNETGLKLYLQFNAETGDVVDFSNECYIVNSYNGPGRTISTDPVGTVGEFVNTTTPTSVGDAGKRMQVTITSTPSSINYLGIYRTGSGTHHYSTETYPAGVDRRSNILWGIQEFGAVTATLVFDYSNVNGADNPDTIKLLKRADAVSAWTDVTTDYTHDTGNRTFTRTGVTEFSEFSIGGGAGNPLAVKIASFLASTSDGQINWLISIMAIMTVIVLVAMHRFLHRRKIQSSASLPDKN